MSKGGIGAGPAGGDSGHLFVKFSGTGLHHTYGNSLLGKILTYKNSIYLLNFLFSVFIPDK